MEVSVQNISKKYNGKLVVRDINLSLTPGVYGLLGANGAGKTTLMRMIGGVLKPTTGKLSFNGEEIESLGEDYYEHLGYLPQEIGFYADFTAREFMMYMAAVKGLKKEAAKKQTEKLLHLVSLKGVADKKINSYSGGMKQRLGIAQAELNDPDILLLDEPTAGLDPKERVRFRNLISNFSKKKIVLLSTHIVSDVAYIADKILMMKEGRLFLQGPMQTIAKEISGKVWELLVTAQEVTEYSRRFSVVNLRHEKEQVRLRIVHDTQPSMDAHLVEPNLEDLFLYYFGADEQGGGQIDADQL